MIKRKDKSKLYKLYKAECIKRVEECAHLCQVCGEYVKLTNEWYYDRWHFDHIIKHGDDTGQQFINGFLFIHQELHIYKNTMAGNLRVENECVKFFFSNYFYSNKSKLFYKKFLEMHPEKIPITIKL